MFVKSIAFVDTRVADYLSLIAALDPGIDVYILDGGLDGIGQIADVMAGYSGVEALHIISHGSEASLLIGSSAFDAESLEAHRADLARIGRSLSAEADILLYGCNVAAGSLGQSFVQAIAAATDADVAASVDVTGAAALGGNAELEYQSGVTGFHDADAFDNIAEFTNIAWPGILLHQFQGLG